MPPPDSRPLSTACAWLLGVLRLASRRLAIRVNVAAQTTPSGDNSQRGWLRARLSALRTMARRELQPVRPAADRASLDGRVTAPLLMSVLCYQAARFACLSDFRRDVEPLFCREDGCL